MVSSSSDEFSIILFGIFENRGNDASGIFYVEAGDVACFWDGEDQCALHQYKKSDG